MNTITELKVKVKLYELAKDLVSNFLSQEENKSVELCDKTADKIAKILEEEETNREGVYVNGL